MVEFTRSLVVIAPPSLVLNAFFDAIQDLGMFWGILNEPPPRTLQAS